MSSTLNYFKRMGSPVAALATATGGPVLVIRVSGRDLSCLEKLFSLEKTAELAFLPAPGSFQLKKLFSADGKILDHALVLFFQSPHSFTGENVVELQIHGSQSLTDEIFRHLGALGIQKALPGEFSFRAVMNDKMTLEQAEALNFVLKSDNLSLEKSRELLGLRQISNDVKTLVTELISDLQKARGRVEAAIDFPEAEIEQAREIESAKNILENALSSVLHFQNAYRNFRKSAASPFVGIVGAPNAGKSTLLNLLSGGQKAIVSALPGTTRDLLEVELSLPSGQKFRLVDTAGIRQLGASDLGTHESVEELGIQRALQLLGDCAAVIWVKNAAESVSDRRLEQEIHKLSPKMLILNSHADQVSGEKPENAFNFVGSNQKELRNFVLRQLDSLIQNSLDSTSESSHILWLSERQSKEIGIVEEKVRASLSSLEGPRPFELIGDDLREAEKALLEVLGQNLGEEYISQIFSQFCLGK